MLIYRVERRTYPNFGPFMFNMLPEKAFNLETHPPPQKDGVENFWSGDDMLGCISKEQLAYWFADCVPALAEANMVVRVFDANPENVKHGNTQVAFSRFQNDIVEEFEVDKFF